MLWLVLIIIICCLLMNVSIHGQMGGGGEDLISVRSGPVDMLIQPKQLLMDGYRFQNTMFPPIEYNREQVTDCQPINRQRVGIFKENAYIDREQVGGNGGSAQGASEQLKARGEQDKYITGDKGDIIIDSTNPFGQWVKYASYNSPEEMREINYPNKIFSWGDVIHRYFNS